jgi:hypothetical protein
MTKSIVTGLLAFAVSSSLVLAQEPAQAAGGWSAKPGTGLKYDGGDAFSFNLVNQLHTQWSFAANENAPDVSTFNVNRARTTMSGHAFNKNIKYLFRVDAVDAGAGIKDAHITWTFMPGDAPIGLRMGQGKVLYGLEGTGSSSGLFFVNRSAAARGFSNARSRGAWVTGAAKENSLRWSVGAMNTDVAGAMTGIAEVGEETANPDNELSYTAAINFDPMGDITEGKGGEGWRQGDFREGDRALKGTVGLGVALGNGVNGGGTDTDSTSINVNTAWSVEGFQFMGELFLRTDDPQGAADEEEPMGFAVSGTYVMPKSGDSAIQWGFGARINMMETDEGAAGSGVANITGLSGIGAVDGEATEFTLVANAFYHGHAAKTQIEYTFQDVDMGTLGDATNHILTIAFQLLF